MDLRTVLSSFVSLSREHHFAAPKFAAASDELALRSRYASVFIYVLKHAVFFNEKTAERTGAALLDGSPFCSAVAPQLHLSEYLERYFVYTRWTPELFVTAAALMDRTVAAIPGGSLLTSMNVRKLWAASTLVAAKMLDDNCYTNTYVARVACVSAEELLELELALLNYTQFNVDVAPAVYESYWKLVDELEHVARRPEGIYGFFQRVSAEREHWVQARRRTCADESPASTTPCTTNATAPRLSLGNKQHVAIAAARGSLKTSTDKFVPEAASKLSSSPTLSVA
eukprot:m51a1_g169 hypothetical protein (284) ;mRNA; r:560559-561712